MKIIKAFKLLAIGSLAAPVALFAHHGTAGTFDQTKSVPVSGVIKELHWRNPHSILVISVKEESGKLTDYSFEIGMPAALARQGFSKDTFKKGDTISFNMHPAFTNPTVGQPTSRKFVINGKEVTGVVDREYQ